MNKLCINYDNNIIMYMYKNLEQEVMLLFGARSNANSITSCSKFLWQPIQANPALQNTHSTRVNDARMQSRFMAKLPSA